VEVFMVGVGDGLLCYVSDVVRGGKSVIKSTR
jgi:hypothetical protein